MKMVSISQMNRRGQRPQAQDIAPVGKPVPSTCHDLDESPRPFQFASDLRKLQRLKLPCAQKGQREGNYDSNRFRSKTLRYPLRRVSPLDSVDCGTHNPTIDAKQYGSWLCFGIRADKLPSVHKKMIIPEWSANRTLQTWAGTCCSVSDNGCRLMWDVVRQLKLIEANHWNRRFSVR